jgi:hypothetical protein
MHSSGLYLLLIVINVSGNSNVDHPHLRPLLRPLLLHELHSSGLCLLLIVSNVSGNFLNVDQTYLRPLLRHELYSSGLCLLSYSQ